MSESSVIQKSEEELDLLKELKNEYETLEQSWKEENEKFIQFQLLANRFITRLGNLSQDFERSLKKSHESWPKTSFSINFLNSGEATSRLHL